MFDPIKQKRIAVPIGEGRTIEVRRMRWKQAKEFLALLAQHVGKLGLKLSEALANLPALIASTSELVDALLAATTDLKPEEREDLDLLELGLVLNAAVDLNLGEELKNCWAGIAQKLANLAGQGSAGDDDAGSTTATKPGENSTPTSSMPASRENT